MLDIRRHSIGILASCLMAVLFSTVEAQERPLLRHPDQQTMTASSDAGVPILLKTSPGDSDRTWAESDGDDASGGFRTRQAILLTGVAVSMLAYGYYALQFNNSRTSSENARLAYVRDVREHAQDYVDQGVALDQIPSYFAWERAWTDAANDRELLTLAGLSAFLLGLAAILDSATAGGSDTPNVQASSVDPVLRVSPLTGDVVLGARLGL